MSTEKSDGAYLEMAAVVQPSESSGRPNETEAGQQNGQYHLQSGSGDPSSYSVVAPPPCARNASVPAAPPPSYDSIFGKVKQIQAESEGKASCIMKVCEWICSTVCCIVCLGPALAVPIFLLVYGILNYHKCPFEPMIPIYLIVTGGLALLHSLIILLKVCIKQIQKRNDPKPPEGGTAESGEQKKIKHPTPKVVKGIEIVISLFSVVWFITGCVFTYKTYKVKPAVSIYNIDPSWCMPQLLLTSFWFINSIFILFGASCALVTCYGCGGK